MRRLSDGSYEGTPAELAEFDRLQAAEPCEQKATGTGGTPRMGTLTVLPANPTSKEEIAKRPHRYRQIKVSRFQYEVAMAMKDWGQPIRRSEISELLSGAQNPEQVSSSLNHLQEKKIVERLPHSTRWQLTERGSNAPLIISHSKK